MEILGPGRAGLLAAFVAAALAMHLRAPALPASAARGAAGPAGLRTSPSQRPAAANEGEHEAGLDRTKDLTERPERPEQAVDNDTQAAPGTRFPEAQLWPGSSGQGSPPESSAERKDNQRARQPRDVITTSHYQPSPGGAGWSPALPKAQVLPSRSPQHKVFPRDFASTNQPGCFA